MSDINDRYIETLIARAEKIASVQNEVYTVGLSRVAVNCIMGIAAIALLVASMVAEGTASVVCLSIGLVLTAASVVFYMIMRSRAPMSYLQLTAKTKTGLYVFQTPKGRAVFSDGTHTVETDGISARLADGIICPECSYDFFTRMRDVKRVGKTNKEIFSGVIDIGDVPTKCRIVFKDGAPYYGKVGRKRIKYFDINTGERFVVPYALRDGARSLGVDWPAKVPGLEITPRPSRPNIDVK